MEDSMNEGFDICYKCGKTQESNTMQDINEIDFDIFCNDCLPKEEENGRYNV